jgi:hypothetical protein
VLAKHSEPHFQPPEGFWTTWSVLGAAVLVDAMLIGFLVFVRLPQRGPWIAQSWPKVVAAEGMIEAVLEEPLASPVAVEAAITGGPCTDEGPGEVSGKEEEATPAVPSSQKRASTEPGCVSHTAVQNLPSPPRQRATAAQTLARNRRKKIT